MHILRENYWKDMFLVQQRSEIQNYLDWKEPNRIAEAIKNKFFPVVEEWVLSALKMVGRYETSCGWYFHEFAGRKSLAANSSSNPNLNP